MTFFCLYEFLVLIEGIWIMAQNNDDRHPFIFKWYLSLCMSQRLSCIYTWTPLLPFGFSSPEGQLPSNRRFCQKRLSSVLWWNRQYIKEFSDLEKKIYIATEYNYFCLLLCLYYFRKNLLDVLDYQMGNGTFFSCGYLFLLKFLLVILPKDSVQK